MKVIKENYSLFHLIRVFMAELFDVANGENVFNGNSQLWWYVGLKNKTKTKQH